MLAYLNLVAFYKEKRLRMGGSEDDIIPAVKISPAEGPFFLSLFFCFLCNASL